MYSCMVEESETMGTNNMIFWDCLSYFKNTLDHCIVHNNNNNNNNNNNGNFICVFECTIVNLAT